MGRGQDMALVCHIKDLDFIAGEMGRYQRDLIREIM